MPCKRLQYAVRPIELLVTESACLMPNKLGIVVFWNLQKSSDDAVINCQWSISTSHCSGRNVFIYQRIYCKLSYVQIFPDMQVVEFCCDLILATQTLESKHTFVCWCNLRGNLTLRLTINYCTLYRLSSDAWRDKRRRSCDNAHCSRFEKKTTVRLGLHSILA